MSHPRSDVLTVGLDAFGFEPHDGQLRFALTPRKEVMACAGRGWGKSKALCLRAILTALNPANDGKAGALLAPTYKQSSRIHQRELRQMMMSFERNTGIKLARWKASEMRWEFITGAELWLLSYERYDNLPGYDLAWAGIDEITTHHNESKVLEIFLPCIRTPGGTHQTFYTCTPRGKRGIVLDYVNAVKVDKDPRFQLIHGTSYDNPHIDPARIDLLKKRLSKAGAEQELGAALLRPSGLVFPEFNKDKHVIPYQYDPSKPYQFWVDWGASSPAFLAAQRTTVDGFDAFVVFWQYVEDDTSYERGRNVLKVKANELGRNPEALAGDRAVPKENQWAGRHFGCRVHTMITKYMQNVWAGVEVVKSVLDPADGTPPRLYFARNLLANDSPRSIIEALQQYKRQMRDGAPIDDPHKDNVTDHVMDALRYGVVAEFDEGIGKFQVFDPYNRGVEFSSVRQWRNRRRRG